MEFYKVLLFNGKVIKYIGDLIEELINVVWLLLGYGVQVNVRDIEMKILLYIILLKLKDLRMVQILCDNGVDFMVSDC